MSYEKTTWADGDVITAEKLNHIEDGIKGSSTGGSDSALSISISINDDGTVSRIERMNWSTNEDEEITSEQLRSLGLHNIKWIHVYTNDSVFSFSGAPIFAYDYTGPSATHLKFFMFDVLDVDVSNYNRGFLSVTYSDIDLDNMTATMRYIRLDSNDGTDGRVYPPSNGTTGK